MSWYIAHSGLLALLGHEVVDAGAHLVDVGGRAVELQLVEGLVHRARRGEREQVRHVRLELVLEQRVVHRGAERRHHGEDVVAVDELGAGLHRARHLVLRVLDDQLDLAAVDAALLVDLVEAHLHRVRRRHAVGGGRPREVGVHAEHDLGLADPARLLLRHRHARQRHRRRSARPIASRFLIARSFRWGSDHRRLTRRRTCRR